MADTIIWYGIMGGLLLGGIAGGVFWRWHYARRERALLYRLEEMIHSAGQGKLKHRAVSENEISVVENQLKRFLEDSQLSVESQERQRSIVQGLISDIAHQTLTPISNLKLYTELLREAEQENTGLTDTIGEQTERLDFLIQSLVKLSRMENGMIHVHPSVTPVKKLLENIQLDYGQKAEEKGISIKINDSELSAVFDLKWTVEALGNIVDNAVKYTAKGGKIEIGAEQYTFFVRIDVRDTGMGISEDELPKVFGRFYRSMSVEDYPGVGIGLYLSREIIQVQKGYIKAASRKGEGSVFSVFLPADGSL